MRYIGVSSLRQVPSRVDTGRGQWRSQPLVVDRMAGSGIDLRPGIRVLGLGCGRAMSSIFLHRKFGVQVWAVYMLCSASENLQRIRDADINEGVFPLRADARALAFGADYFDAIVHIDSFLYYGTDNLYLNELVRSLKPGGQIGLARSGRELYRPNSIYPFLRNTDKHHFYAV